MTPAVAMALALAANPPLGLVKLVEHLPVPGAVRVVPAPFARTLRVELAAGAPAADLARRLRGDSRTCPDVRADGDALVLRCNTEKVRAQLEKGALVLFRLAVLPWRPGEEGPPIAALDTEAVGLGPCPGASPLARGECALAAGDLGAARRHFAEASRVESPHAWMRLGDLALAGDDPDGAVHAWRKARSEAPWSRLVAMRLCELEPGCVGSAMEDAVYDPAGAPIAFRADVVLRRARLRAFRGDVVGAAEALAREARLGGACSAAPGWCRQVLFTALRLPPPEGAAALAVYLDTPGRGEGPDTLPLARLAARQAEAAGAPVWAANLLASLNGRVPASEEGPHLLRIAQLYLAGGDRVRADEIHRFARTRLARAELARPPWRAVAAALRQRPRAVAAADAGPDLAAARAALDAARLAGLRKGHTP